MSRRWSELKISVENFFADCVKGRVELRSVSYRKAHDATGRGYITVDGVTVWSMCFLTFQREEYYRSTQRKESGAPHNQNELRKEMAAEGLYSQETYCGYLKEYCSLSIDDIIKSDIVLIRALGMIDRRLGKRRIASINVCEEHEMVKYFHRLRCQFNEVPNHI